MRQSVVYPDDVCTQEVGLGKIERSSFVYESKPSLQNRSMNVQMLASSWKAATDDFPMEFH